MEGAPKIIAFEQESLENTLNIEHHLDSEEFDSRVKKFCTEILNRENKIDDGNFANVFVEEGEYPGLCFKKLKPLREPKNSVHEEGKILDEIKDGVENDVRTPMPYVSAEQYVKHENGRISKRRLLVMERIDGVTLRDIIEPVSADKKQDLPENFDVEDYFSKLKNFFTKLHENHKIYHRDINLGNLMIQSESLNPAVIDFGESFWGDSGEDEDPYGRAIVVDLEREDVDLKKLSEIEERMRQFIDKKNI